MEQLSVDIKFYIFQQEQGLIAKEKCDSILLDLYAKVSWGIMKSSTPLSFNEIIKDIGYLCFLMKGRADNTSGIALLLAQYCGFSYKVIKEEFCEMDIEKKVVSYFSEIAKFKQYDYINNQVVTKHGRIDILAKCKETLRPVIIEIKKGATSAHRQLFDYADDFNNPILINLSEFECKKRKEGIIYYSLADLFG